MDFFRVFGVAVSCQKRIIIFIKEQIAVLWKGVLFGEEDRVVKAKYSIKNHYGFIIRIIIRLKYGKIAGLLAAERKDIDQGQLQ